MALCIYRPRVRYATRHPRVLFPRYLQQKRANAIMGKRVRAPRVRVRKSTRGTPGRVSTIHSDRVREHVARKPARVIAPPEQVREAAKLFAAGQITAEELSKRLRAI